MSTVFAIELDDRALAFALDGQVISSEPSAVFSGGEEPVGSAAWQSLRRNPTRTSTRHLRELGRESGVRQSSMLVAAELARRLAAVDLPADARVWVAAPANFDSRALGALLGATANLDFPIDGFVDAAVARVAALGLDRTALSLDIGLHHIAVTAVQGGGQAQRRRAVVNDHGGLLELYQVWLDLISSTMVKRTRFDPLHDATIEQQLFDALPVLAREATAKGSAVAAVNVGSDRFEVSLSRDQFAQAGEPIYREMLRQLHELRPAGAPITLLVPALVLELPGLREAFDQFMGCELIGVTDGFAAAALSQLDFAPRAEGEPVRLLRRLPSRRHAEGDSMLTREILGRETTQTPQASHVLYGGKAFSLSRDALVVGRVPAAAYALVMPEGLGGVSRRHCSFVRVAGDVVLVDHSSYGTFVNGERVVERVRVHAGDRVRIGEPGVELSLIAVGDPTGTTHAPSSKG